ncbi:ribosome maturation factor RimM [Acidimicrobiia bacterium EGI L10123]|uniref:ribosome maturation factor RimM n=1 Tax=Salinilacustrithrix flava TaxID=2957203 RepID=UPI003D7C2E5B|nr:ribosome maturation factor RimM [Acidimicrobiia bacterium EGI L10123]
MPESGRSAGAPLPELLEVGTIAKPHGLKGEVIVALLTDREDRLAAGSVLQTDRGPLTVVEAHPHQHRWRVRFEGFATREDVDPLHGLVLRAEPVDDPDVWFVHELIGLPVVLTDGTEVGTCTAIIDNPAHDLVELDDGRLVPLPFVVDVGDVIEIDPPEGLLDLA